jgi:DNA-directed RNA polymerase sigma subunit (sigma70/sigma32)
MTARKTLGEMFWEERRSRGGVDVEPRSFRDEEDARIRAIDFKKKLDEGAARMRERLKAMVAGLTPKEREILCKRFGVSTVEELEERVAAGTLAKGVPHG